MTDKQKIIAIIPARGGSKGVPRKNIKPLAGKPLIAYTIEASLKSNLVDRTIVSTEDAEIAAVARKYGAEVIKRPAKLATDTALTEPVLQHVVKYLEKKEKYSPDLIVLLQPTSPLKEEGDIDNAINTLLKAKADSLVSVCKFHGFVWKRTNNFAKPLNYSPKNRPRRQEMKQYLENGSIYITKRGVLMKENSRLGCKMVIYVMDEENSFDIDTRFDFWLVGQIMKNQRQKTL